MIGVAMGAANVIPGVSGGTIAFISGIYERLINALKSLDLDALKLLTQGKIKALLVHVDFWFLVSLFAGVALSIISLAKLLKYLFGEYPVLVWAFFFGLILASIYFVGRTVGKWAVPQLAGAVVFATVAASISFFTPAVENPAFFYVFICGIIAICSMILPGLSGSFVLLLMGNYLLVLGAISAMDFGIIIPMALGCVVGLVVFSRFLSWLFDNYRDLTIASMTGFIVGSLATIWPWKTAEYLKDASGELVLRKGEPKVIGYNWQLPEVFGGALPDSFAGETWVALLMMLLGMIILIVVEKAGSAKSIT